MSLASNVNSHLNSMRPRPLQLTDHDFKATELYQIQLCLWSCNAQSKKEIWPFQKLQTKRIEI